MDITQFLSRQNTDDESETDTQTALPPLPQNRTKHCDRGIYFTFDAIAMVVVLLGSLIVSFQVLPSSGSPQADLATTELQTQASDVLDGSKATGQLEDATLYWDDSDGEWVDGGDSYSELPAGHPLISILSNYVDRAGVQYEVSITYLEQGAGTGRQRIVYQGTPGSEAVVAETTVSISDDTNLVGPDSGTTVSDSSTFYAPDAFPDSNRYNVLTVQLIIWER